MTVDDIIREASKHSSRSSWAAAYQIYAEAIASPTARSPRDSSRLHNEAGLMARNLAVDAFNLGIMGDYRQQLAISHYHYDAAIAADDTFWRPFVNKANLLARDEQRYVEAIPYYDKAALGNPSDADVFNNRGITYASLGRTDLARADWEQTIAINPHHSNARENLALVSPFAAQRNQSGCLPLLVLFVLKATLWLSGGN